MRTDRHFLHQKIVAYARAHGIKAAAREFGASRNTIRKWLRRYIPGKPSSLVESSRAPKSCPHKTPAGLEGQVVKLRKQTGFGAERLVQEFDLKISHNAVARIIRAHSLTRPRKKKPATKKQLRSVKREWKLFGQLTADTKYLQDIPNYWPQMMRHRLPRFQYTAREPVSGACFAAYADELSKSYAVSAVSAALNGILADAFALYLKTKNFHWHVSGPHFRDYHLMLDEQADQIFATTDQLAERVLKIGGTTVRSIGHISKLQSIEDNDAAFVAPLDMLRELMNDNKHVAAAMRA